MVRALVWISLMAIVSCTSYAPRVTFLFRPSMESIRGRVLLADGSPLEGAKIVAVLRHKDPGGGSGVDRSPVEEYRREAWTDARGEFELAGLVCAPHELTGSHPNGSIECQLGRVTSVYPGSFVSLRAEEHAPYTVRIDVRRPDGSIPDEADVWVDPAPRSFRPNDDQIDDSRFAGFFRRCFHWSPKQREFTVRYDVTLTAQLPGLSRSEPVTLALSKPQKLVAMNARLVPGITLDVNLAPDETRRVTHSGIMRIDPARPPSDEAFIRGANWTELHGRFQPDVFECPAGTYRVAITLGTGHTTNWNLTVARGGRADHSTIVQVDDRPAAASFTVPAPEPGEDVSAAPVPAASRVSRTRATQLRIPRRVRVLENAVEVPFAEIAVGVSHSDPVGLGGAPWSPAARYVELPRGSSTSIRAFSGLEFASQTRVVEPTDLLNPTSLELNLRPTSALIAILETPPEVHRVLLYAARTRDGAFSARDLQEYGTEIQIAGGVGTLRGLEPGKYQLGVSFGVVPILETWMVDVGPGINTTRRDVRNLGRPEILELTVENAQGEAVVGITEFDVGASIGNASVSSCAPPIAANCNRYWIQLDRDTLDVLDHGGRAEFDFECDQGYATVRVNPGQSKYAVRLPQRSALRVDLPGYFGSGLEGLLDVYTFPNSDDLERRIDQASAEDFWEGCVDLRPDWLGESRFSDLAPGETVVVLKRTELSSDGRHKSHEIARRTVFLKPGDNRLVLPVPSDAVDR